MFWGCFVGLQAGPNIFWDKEWGNKTAVGYRQRILPGLSNWFGRAQETVLICSLCMIMQQFTERPLWIIIWTHRGLNIWLGRTIHLISALSRMYGVWWKPSYRSVWRLGSGEAAAKGRGSSSCARGLAGVYQPWNLNGNPWGDACQMWRCDSGRGRTYRSLVRAVLTENEPLEYSFQTSILSKIEWRR